METEIERDIKTHPEINTKELPNGWRIHKLWHESVLHTGWWIDLRNSQQDSGLGRGPTKQMAFNEAMVIVNKYEAM